MISLDQIRLLEGKISRAIELIRVLKEENSSLRKGLDSAQKRVKELEGLVDGFKTDQKEIESVIMRTLKNLDDIEDQIHSSGAAVSAPAESSRPAPARKPERPQAATGETGVPRPTAHAPAVEKAAAQTHEKPAPIPQPAAGPAVQPIEPAALDSSKGELDIF